MFAMRCRNDIISNQEIIYIYMALMATISKYIYDPFNADNSVQITWR